MISAVGLTNTSQKPSHRPWERETKIVLGIDVGTNTSSVSFTLLTTGLERTFHRVTHWPGQEATNQSCEVPSLVWYNTRGEAVSFGAEALSPASQEDAEDNGWQLAKNFMLHISPSGLDIEHGPRLDPLPIGVSLGQIYTDFLRYILKHAQTFFEDRILDGIHVWKIYQPHIEIVMTHPNGWGMSEQALLWSALMNAGWASTSSSQNIRFVTETEALAHLYSCYTGLDSFLQADVVFAVCIAGDSNVETVVYSVTATHPTLMIEEVRPSASPVMVGIQTGAKFVDLAIEEYLRHTFQRASLSSEDIEDYTKWGVKNFSLCMKRRFSDLSENCIVEVAGSRFNNSSIGARRGKLTLPGQVVQSFFGPVLSDITTSVEQQIQGLNVSYLLFAGEFSEIPFVRQRFKSWYEPRGYRTILVDNSSPKAVAAGAVIWAADRTEAEGWPTTGLASPYLNSFRDPWNSETKIAIGIDVGTTESSVAFSIFSKGLDQTIHRVMTWPGQESARPQSKTPTLVWYDTDGKAVSFGAEVLLPKVEEEAEKHEWVKYGLGIDPLPLEVSLRQIYTDFLRYMLEHTRSFFEDHMVHGPFAWRTSISRTEVVITHPNEWGSREQNFLRSAAMNAGWTSFPQNIQFVTEVKASMRFCLHQTALDTRLQTGDMFVVCDIGGWAADMTVYLVVTTHPTLVLEEIRTSANVQSGAKSVDAAVVKYLIHTLRCVSMSEENIQDFTERGVKDFANHLKPYFSDPTRGYTVEIAGSRFNDNSIGTRRGKMTLPGALVQSFFDACLDEIITSVDKQIQGLDVSYLLLVGELGESPYVHKKFKSRYEPQGCQMVLSTDKGVADGAVIWAATHRSETEDARSWPVEG